jgi:DNA polymerase III subunit delta
MILRGAEASRYFAKPDPSRAGLLIFGADPMRVALRRQEVVAALIGPDGPGEMRLTRMSAADLRKDPALLMDGLTAQGFFPGSRVALLEEATDGLTALVEAALKDWRPGDAHLIVTAGGLTKNSTLKKLFETRPDVYAAGLYDEPPSREEIEASLKKAGLTSIDRDAMADLTTLARALDPGDFRQTLEKISLYKWGDTAPLTPAEVAVMAPATIEAALDDLLNAVADGKSSLLGPLLRRLEAQGVNPVSLCIGALRHFRILHAASADPGGPASGIARARPPVFGPRRDVMVRQASGWGLRALEQALALLVETDLTLRSTSRAPSMALMERAFIRLAMIRR